MNVIRIKGFYHYLLLCLICLGCSKNNNRLVVENAIYLKNGTIITSNESEEIITTQGHIVIEGDSILYCNNIEPIIFGEHETIDVNGKYIIPGLIDSHVHLGHTGIFNDAHHEEQPKLIKQYFNQLPKAYLYYGFTTLIDLDLRERTKKQFLNSEIHPNLYSTGRGVRYLDGYGQSLFPKGFRYKIFPNWIYDKGQVLPKDITIEEHTVSYVVNQAKKNNAIGLKTYYEKGFGGAFNWPVPSDSLLNNLTNKSHKNNLPVLLHATSLEGYRKGLENNIDIFAHGLWHWKGDILDSKPPVYLSDLYKEIAKSSKYIQSTSRVILGEYDTYKASILKSDEIKNIYSADILKFINSEEGSWAQKELKDLYDKNKKNKDATNEDYFESMNKRVLSTIKLAVDNNVKVILGSDTPASDGIGNPPGLNGFLEIKSLSEAGISNKEIFVIATYRNAKAFGLQKEIGAIKKGMSADLLILNKNPLQNVEAYNSIERVIINGNLIKRSSLSARNPH